MTIKRMDVAGARQMAGNASVSWLALLVALGCAGYVFWIQLAPAGSALRPLAGQQASSKQTGTAALPDATDSRELSVRLARLEDRLPGARVASEAAQAEAEKLRQERDQIRQLYENTLHDSVQMTLHDIESLLGQANRALIGSTNFAGPISLLGAARERIARASTPNLLALSEALDADRDGLLKLAERSVAQAADQLNRLASVVGNLALPGDPKKNPSTASGAGVASSDDSFWKRVVKSSEELVSLPDRPNGQAFTQASARYFLVESLRLRLLGARLSLLQHDRDGFEADRARCVAWLNEHFDSADESVAAALATLAELKSFGGTAADGSIQRSLDALEAARNSLLTQGKGERS